MPIGNNKKRRGVIYIKDIEIITGRKTASAQRLLSKIRKKFQKRRDEFVTIREFSLHTGIDEETIYELLTD